MVNRRQESCIQGQIGNVLWFLLTTPLETKPQKPVTVAVPITQEADNGFTTSLWFRQSLDLNFGLFQLTRGCAGSWRQWILLFGTKAPSWKKLHRNQNTSAESCVHSVGYSSVEKRFSKESWQCVCKNLVDFFIYICMRALTESCSLSYSLIFPPHISMAILLHLSNSWMKHHPHHTVEWQKSTAISVLQISNSGLCGLPLGPTKA